jgi:hypothetical protein
MSGLLEAMEEWRRASNQVVEAEDRREDASREVERISGMSPERVYDGMRKLLAPVSS